MPMAMVRLSICRLLADRYTSFQMPSIKEEKRSLFIEEYSLSNSDTESENSSSTTRSRSSSIRQEVEARFGKIRWASTTKAYSNLLRPSSWGSVLRRTAIFLLPSFTHHRISSARERRNSSISDSNTSNGGGGGGNGSSNKKTLSPTAYLDGMRGLAALFVYFCHYFYTSFVISEGYYRFSPSSDPDLPSSSTTASTYTSLWRLPFIRLLYSGPSMVCVFFVISGYALSLRPLQQLSHHKYTNPEAAFSRTVSSLVFRRFFRLYLPPVISTLSIVILLRLGAYEGTRSFSTDRTFVRNVIEHHPPRLDSFSAQTTHWGREMWDFVHIWGWENVYGGSTGYDVHLWTIPVEFRCSMMLFLVLVGTARLRENVRLVALGVFAWFVLRSDRWEMLLFLAGLVIAELDVRRGAHEGCGGTALGNAQSMSAGSSSSPMLLLPLSEKTDTGTFLPKLYSTKVSFWTLVSIPALYLLSSPDAGPYDVPGYIVLSTLIPSWFSEKYRFWQAVGACLFVFCTARSRGWQRVFERAPVQYLGRVSYAMYLCHGPVTHVVGFVVQRWAWRITGTESEHAYTMGGVLAAFVNIPLLIWVADVFWRAVDVPTVRFAKWLEARLSVDNAY
ncbi:acyltransferase family-domain-containing protein [Xylariaceae sp. AK1471]|nr:acyltransferase family-domain-containing protein [Xylariaceae sp. AK1471]